MKNENFVDIYQIVFENYMYDIAVCVSEILIKINLFYAF